MPKTGTDYTERMRAFAAKHLEALGGERLSGDIVKKDSPSCGMERVRLYPSYGVPDKSGQGLFAAALMQHFPYVPSKVEGSANTQHS